MRKVQCCGAFLAIFALTGCDGTEQAVMIQPSVPAVTVVAVANEEIKPSLTFSGRIEARDRVDLRARVQGFLQKRLFTEGQDVKEGDLLFVIEQDSYQASISEIEANIEKAQASLTLATLEVERQSTLVQRQTGTQQKLDVAVAQQSEGRADVAAQQAALEKAKLQLGYTEIRAPIAGRIGRAIVSAGNYVEPSTGTLATIVSQDPIYVSFPVTQREMIEVRKNRKDGALDPTIYLQLADGSRYEQPGKVNFVDVAVNQGSDTVIVRAEFTNPDRILVDGQLVTVIAETGQPETALVIPQQSILLDQAGAYVLVVDGADTVELRRVEVAQATGPTLRVTKGLQAGEKIITEGIQKVRPGQTVQVSEASS